MTNQKSKFFFYKQTKMLKDDTKPVPEDLNVQVSSEGILLTCSTQGTHAPLGPRPGQASYTGGIWDQSSSVNKTLIMYSRNWTGLFLY